MMSTHSPRNLRPGLVSITFRNLSPDEIIQLCLETKLQGIEWGGDVHVPHGNIQQAREVRRHCADAGLEIAAYGSYYYVGHNENFESVLETAQELGAPLIRVWAGKIDAQDAHEKYFWNIVGRSRQMGDLAKAMNIKLAYEFHGKTLNNSAAASKVLFDAIDQSAWQTLWQPLAIEPLPQTESIKSLLPHLANLHVYHWENYRNRFALADGADNWQKYFSLANDGVPRWALLEFVRDDNPANLREDAAVLHQLLAIISSPKSAEKATALPAYGYL
jgi:sugar phosphate isomerase/epimerase